MWKWLISHPTELQAFGIIATSVLTFALILLTAVYARANWKTMRLMQADLKYRVTPLPRIEQGHGHADADGALFYVFTVTPSNAPMLFENMRLDMKFVGDITVSDSVGGPELRPIAVR